MKKRFSVIALVVCALLVGYGLGQRKGNLELTRLSNLVMCANYSSRVTFPSSPIQYSFSANKPCPDVGEITFLNGSSPQAILDLLNNTARTEFNVGENSGGLQGYAAGNTQGMLQGQMMVNP